MAGKCSFAFPGTYGHECGRPAKWGQRLANPDREWINFWCVRCDECRTAEGPDNRGMRPDAWTAYDPTTMVQTLIINRWPNPPTTRSWPA